MRLECLASIGVNFRAVKSALARMTMVRVGHFDLDELFLIYLALFFFRKLFLNGIKLFSLLLVHCLRSGHVEDAEDSSQHVMLNLGLVILDLRLVL